MLLPFPRRRIEHRDIPNKNKALLCIEHCYGLTYHRTLEKDGHKMLYQMNYHIKSINDYLNYLLCLNFSSIYVFIRFQFRHFFSLFTCMYDWLFGRNINFYSSTYLLAFCVAFLFCVVLVKLCIYPLLLKHSRRRPEHCPATAPFSCFV